MIAVTSNDNRYFHKHLVWKYPSTMRNAKTGKAIRPIHLISSYTHLSSASMTGARRYNAIWSTVMETTATNFNILPLRQLPNAYSLFFWFITIHTTQLLPSTDESCQL